MAKDSKDKDDNDDEGEEVEVILVEEPAPHTIETGDSIKVKQVLDDATVEGIKKAGYSINYSWENFKLLIMFISCVFAMLAQFYPIPFPKSRPLLGICCASYFILSGVLQCIVTFIDKDTILFTLPKKEGNSDSKNSKVIMPALQIRTSFPRFQEFLTLIIQFKPTRDNDSNSNNNKITVKMYVGRYFTTKGDFDEEAYIEDVKSVVKRFEEKDFKAEPIIYDKYKKAKSD